MKKGQTGVEFLYFVGIAVVILIVYLLLSSNYLDFASSRREILAVNNLLDEARNEINLAGRVEDGYSKKFILPNDINGKNYSIKLQDREIYITLDGNDYSRLLSTDVNLIGNLAPGKTLLISKLNNEVTVEVQ